jgi:carbonic anhydrase/acetyltransferase-like protein (isoleucine patch superfamily)
VGVSVGVSVGDSVAVGVGASVAVSVGVSVGVFVGVSTGVSVGVSVAVPSVPSGQPARAVTDVAAAAPRNRRRVRVSLPAPVSSRFRSMRAGITAIVKKNVPEFPRNVIL